MEQKQQVVKVTSSGDLYLTELEVEAIVERKIDPIQNAINVDSAPYLTVSHFLWAVGMLVTVMSAILGYLWKKMASEDRRIDQRIDMANTEMEAKEDKLRLEFNNKHERLDDRVWKLGLHIELKSGDVLFLNGPPEKDEKKDLTDKKTEDN